MFVRLMSPRGAMLSLALFAAALAHSFSEYQAEAHASAAFHARGGQSPTVPVSRSLQADFARAGDWRAFALSSLQRAAEGGHFYARHVFELCSRNAGAMDDLGRKHCAGFGAGEPQRRLAELQASLSASSDPLVQAERALLAARANAQGGSGHQGDSGAAVARMLALRDPLLISEHELRGRVAAIRSREPLRAGSPGG